MGPATTRRDFLEILLGGAAGLSLPSRVFGQSAPSRITTTSLDDSLTLFSGAGGNVLAAAGSDGLWLVNGGLQERSADLLDAIAKHTGRARVEGLFDTDWHPDRTGSNEALGRAGAKIVAHEYARQYLAAEIYVDWQNRTYQPLPAQALPNRTFYGSGTIEVGSDRIDYGHLGQAHTDAAIYVHFRQANVLVAGGALSVGSYPIPDYTTGGWLGGLLAANKTLLGLSTDDTRIVPGTGPVQTRADLQAQHDMLAAVMERFTKAIKQGMGPDDIISAALTKDFDGAWGNPDLFVTTAYRSLWLHVRELGGIV
ncbi:MAG TPA: MBL fold metallo-hydrolase [Vicinamibacterales bacterium]|jgi:glyoxylase-like metal-dependent hydrolase (beta-lactamase superfamily II)|nr:MBL fold metallo-hydrolase [Vicinamibacterales bacterium]